MAYTKTTWVNNSQPYINADNLNNIENGIETNDIAINTIQANMLGLSGTMLWTNPNPTSSFSTQNIVLNSSDYDCYEIVFSPNVTTNPVASTGTIPKGYGVRLSSVYTGSAGAGVRVRDITYVNATTLTAGTGKQTIGTTPESTNDERCVPLYVIGYKTGLFS